MEESDTGRPDTYNWDAKLPPRWLPRAILYVLLGITAFVLLRSLVERIHDLLVILLVSLFASFAIEPAVDWLADRGWKRGAATAMVFALVTVVGGVLVFLVVDLVVQQVRALVEDAPDMVAEATKWVNDRFNTNITTDSIIEQLRGYQDDFANSAGDVGGRVVSITGSLLGLLFNGLTVALFTFYLVADGPRVRRSLCSVLPQGQQRTVLGLWELSIHKTGGYLYSRVLLATISAFFTWIALTIIGVPGPVALAVWSGVVSQFVPVIGAYIGGALPALIALLDKPIDALWVLAFIAVYQQVENYFLSPRISSRTMAIHPAVAFGSAIVGAQILGPIGAFLALPAAAIVQAFVSSYLQRYELVESPALAEPDEDADPEVDQAADDALAKADQASGERPAEPDS